MKSYINVKVVGKSDKILFERCLPDCECITFDFDSIVRTLHVFFPQSSVVISSSLPKIV